MISFGDSGRNGNFRAKITKKLSQNSEKEFFWEKICFAIL